MKIETYAYVKHTKRMILRMLQIINIKRDLPPPIFLYLKNIGTLCGFQ